MTKIALSMPVSEPIYDSSELVGPSSLTISSPNPVAWVRIEESMAPVGNVTVSPWEDVSFEAYRRGCEDSLRKSWVAG